MTRKEYELIAYHLKDTRKEIFEDAMDGFCRAFKSNNPRFSREKFYDAVYGEN